MAVRNGTAVKIVTHANGGVPTILKYPQEDSQTFDAGELVYLSAAGLLTVCADDEILVLGIAREDGTNTALKGSTGNAEIAVEVIFPGDICEIDTSSTATFAGSSYELDNSVGIYTRLNVGAPTSGKEAFIVLKQMKNTAGTLIARAKGTFLTSVLQTTNSTAATS